MKRIKPLFSLITTPISRCTARYLSQYCYNMPINYANCISVQHKH